MRISVCLGNPCCVSCAAVAAAVANLLDDFGAAHDALFDIRADLVRVDFDVHALGADRGVAVDFVPTQIPSKTQKRDGGRANQGQNVPHESILPLGGTERETTVAASGIPWRAGQVQTTRRPAGERTIGPGLPPERKMWD